MTSIEESPARPLLKRRLKKVLVDRAEIQGRDPQEYDFEADMDTSLEYQEAKDHVLDLHPELQVEAPGRGEAHDGRGDHLAWLAYEKYWKGRKHSKICPRCGELGSGPHAKWVLNCQKRRYEPYYYWAHSIKVEGKYKVRWHYIGRWEGERQSTNIET